MRILITGANGFVGSSASASFLAAGHEVVALQRTATAQPPKAHPLLQQLQSDLSDSSALRAAMRGCDAIVHTAARVHRLQDPDPSPLTAYRRTNTDLTLQLATLAAQCGVKRFVFLSSIKVNGEWTAPGHAFHADDLASAQDSYAISKQEAEDGLRQVARQTGLEVVIVRLPLVYGPGVKANFLRMMAWVDRGAPLPLGAINNRRSLVGLSNLTHFLELCARHPAAGNETFLVSDGADVSTSRLLRAMGQALGRPARLVPIPQKWLEQGLRWLGQGALVQRLCADLAVDIEKNQRLLNWTPPVALEQELQLTARAYKAQRAASHAASASGDFT
ncbi:NAD-dependent epimerase/dehydratase family protein [Hydrogenophaga sp.]|uniref:NAD-dependent epimerase/dehydratase family protein n=1 Tax=Hydrogenophaga sp. TaxID=1904254 RepID=UPI003F6AFA3F